jgi:cytochrome c
MSIRPAGRVKSRKAFLWAVGVGLLSLAPLATLSARAAPPDAERGRDVFAKRCSGCHALDSDKEGPRLRGVFGRKAGSVAGFPYSDAVRNSGIVWDENHLNRWLENPEQIVKDNNMEFHVGDAAERAALVAFLKSADSKSDRK